MANFIVVLIVAVVVGLAGKKVYSDMKNNKCSCGSSCGKSCPSKGTCNSTIDIKNKK